MYRQQQIELPRFPGETLYPSLQSNHEDMTFEPDINSYEDILEKKQQHIPPDFSPHFVNQQFQQQPQEQQQPQDHPEQQQQDPHLKQQEESYYNNDKRQQKVAGRKNPNKLSATETVVVIALALAFLTLFICLLFV